MDQTVGVLIALAPSSLVGSGPRSRHNTWRATPILYHSCHFCVGTPAFFWRFCTVTLLFACKMAAV